MKKTAYLIFGVLFLSFSQEANAQEKLSEEQMIALAKQIHEKTITIDTHIDINVANFTPEKNYTQDLPTQVTLPKMKVGGLNTAWFIVYTGQGPLDAEGYQKAYDNAIAKFEAIHRLCNEFAPNEIELALTSQDVRNIRKKGKMVAMIGIENGYPIGEDIGNVKKFYDLGARYMSLSHNGHSQLSDSNTGEEDGVWLHNGLSELGKQVIAEMNKHGMMIDVSHPSKEAMRQMVELSKAPIIASHSSARALCNHSRNLDDEQLMWLKQNGGVAQTVAFSAYVNTEKHEAFNRIAQKIYEETAASMNVAWISRDSVMKLPTAEREAYFAQYMKVMAAAKPKVEAAKAQNNPVNVADFVDHIDYMVQKIGIDHVGISSDFDGGGGVFGWNDASETFNVTLELVKRGYTEEDIEKLWGGNLLRVLDKVQEIAGKM